MRGTTYPKRQVLQSGNQTEEGRHWGRLVRWALWGCGFLVLVIAAVLVHMHPKPYPLDLTVMKDVQANHTPFYGLIMFVSSFNDVVPSTIALFVWFIALAILRWFQQAIFILLTTLGADGADVTFNTLVSRPRPTPQYGIQVMTNQPFHSFPSGHAEHVVAYYGFLLFLSLTKPVRQWRYRWFLLPFQIILALIILTIGYSRVLEGEHWPTDVLGGYLSGALWLSLFIALYLWVDRHPDLVRARLKKVWLTVKGVGRHS